MGMDILFVADLPQGYVEQVMLASLSLVIISIFVKYHHVSTQISCFMM